ncbi:SNF7 family [Pyrenophora seminiperda CCB06]|uniref:SNF7 family n=1 Tax=Pyrenophora seminiperda CCB06 TaxID=1302712 RepID=A0A3M7MDX1_9PLEO|nr:SNF7 family [Pyrenophora seminiperda CCB06]
MPFAQLVIGPPGSGKSTYCDGMQQFMGAIERKCSVVNLDPANDHTSYQPAVDVRDLVTIDEIMEQESLGPNGGVLFALEELEHNFEWLEEGLKELGVPLQSYGRGHGSNVLSQMTTFFLTAQAKSNCSHITGRCGTSSSAFKNWGIEYSPTIQAWQLEANNVAACRRTLDGFDYSLATIVMDLPHINVLTKIDNLRNYPDLPFNLDYYTEVQDLHYLLPHLNREQASGIPGPTTAGANEMADADDNEPTSKFSALNKAIVELVEDFALVGFETLAVEDKESMMTLLRAIDRAGGFAVGGVEGVNDTVWQMAMRDHGATMDARDVQERWLERRDELDEEERKAWENETKDMRNLPTQQTAPAASKPLSKPKDEDGDDDMDDLEEMRQFMEKKKDTGINIVKNTGSRPSMFSDDPALGRQKRKRVLFRPRQNKPKPQWIPAPERSMSELLDFVLQHEDAFKNHYRLASLYADFREQLDINPEGYRANITAWTKALTDAARAGVIPTQGTTHDLLNIRASNALAQALRHPQHGQPTCLPAVFHEAVQRKEMIPMTDFLSSRESIYKASWIPSPWKVLQWGLRQVGVLGQSQSPPRKLETGDFVVVKNIEVAADEILKKMKEHTSTADRVLSKADFSKRFATVLNPSAPLTTNDVNVLLVFLARDKNAISYNAQTIKFKSEHEAAPSPVTEQDTAITKLRDTLAKINAEISSLMERISAADAAAREAVADKRMVNAKAALRSKKLAENALAQRSDIALQLEQAYADLQHAADQVEIVEAMRAGAAALKILNEKVGGAEGVQGVVDAVNEQITTTEEISNIINETSQPLDEGEIDDEFEALEREEARKTQARLAKLDAVEKRRAEKLAAREKEAQAVAERNKDERTEEQVEKVSYRMEKMSIHKQDIGETEDTEQEAEQERVPVYA